MLQVALVFALFAINVQNSTMTVHVGKQGVFSFLADNHEIAAPIASGSYDSTAKTVTLMVEAAKLRVLDPKLPADKRASVQENTTGPKVLDAARYPTISFRSTKITETDATHWKIDGDLTLHGQTHPIAVQALKIDATHFSGSATIRQTAFGITPIRVAAGSVVVRDDVRVEFQITL